MDKYTYVQYTFGCCWRFLIRRGEIVLAKRPLKKTDTSRDSQIDAVCLPPGETGRIIWDSGYKSLGFVASSSEEVVTLCRTRVPLLLEEEGFPAPMINGIWVDGLTEEHVDILCQSFEVGEHRRYSYWVWVFYQLNCSLFDDPDWDPEMVEGLRVEMKDVPSALVLFVLAVARLAEENMPLTLEAQKRVLGGKDVEHAYKRVVESLSELRGATGGDAKIDKAESELGRLVESEIAGRSREAEYRSKGKRLQKVEGKPPVSEEVFLAYNCLSQVIGTKSRGDLLAMFVENLPDQNALYRWRSRRKTPKNT